MDQEIDRQELARYCEQLFDGDRRGRYVLQYLIARWAGNSPAVTGGIDAVLKTYRDAGSRMVLDDLLMLIDQGRSPVPDDFADPLSTE